MSELEFWKDLGNIFDAVMNYQKKNVEFNNNFINPWIRLGNIFEKQDQNNDAVQAYQRAIEIDPENIQNWINLGDSQFKKGDYEEGANAYRKAVTLDPEAGLPLSNLALCLVNQGRPEEAVPLYLKSIDLLTEVKDKAICWNRLGNVYRKLNDYENAFLAFQKADQLDGENTGFNDTLDETSPNISIVAPEEILDQMETLETPLALKPNMEMIVEENITKTDHPLDQLNIDNVMEEEEEESPLILHEKNFNTLEVIEMVIAKVEQTFSEQETEELKNKEEPRRVPDWLILRDDMENASAKTQEQFDAVEVVTVNSLVVNMNLVETYTDPITAQVTESSLGEESSRDTSIKIQGETDTPAPETLKMPEMSESAFGEEPAASNIKKLELELAYEEYLKDTFETANVLADHLPEVNSETPSAKVSKNGDVRIVMDTKNAHVWNELGNIYLNAGAYDDAIASYSRAIELDRHFAWPYSNLALAYVQKERFAEAILLYQRGIELFASDKDKAVTWNRLGNVYRRINDYNNAIASYQTADELDPENATLSLRSSFGLLGNVYSESKPAYAA